MARSGRASVLGEEEAGNETAEPVDPVCGVGALGWTINANHFTVKNQINLQGVSGTGEVTGTKYQATEVFTNQSSGAISSNAPFEQTSVGNEHFVGQGPGNNFNFHFTFHVTINANGDLTAFVDNFSVDCS